MLLQIAALAAIFIFYILSNYDIKGYIRNTRLLMKLPSRPMIPIIGWTMKLAFIKPEDIFFVMLEEIQNFKVLKTWVLGKPIAVVLEPDDVEMVLSSMSHITKGEHYEGLREWLQNGLLTSSGEKWHSRRKHLTPAFHFKILEDCLPVMNRNAEILAKKLLATGGKPFGPCDYVSCCTLDIICETAMGVKLNAQNDESKQYVFDIMRICEIIMLRELNFWQKIKVFFNLSPTGREFYAILNRIHSFTEKVIEERKKIYMKAVETGDKNLVKKKKAFLDCMIDMEMKNPGSFSSLDMREEVDTFMFEGHDTTSTAIMFALMHLGMNEDIQDKVAEELRDIFGESDRETTSKDLQEMQYLEKVIKECLRMTPSVPIISRFLNEDLLLKTGYLVPKGTNLFIIPMYYHHSEKFFEKPLTFNPERFNEENSKKRHPYLHIPFSAGPRNCIGQKFAMMELKLTLSTIIRYNKINFISSWDTLKILPLLILRPSEPLMMEFTPRNLIPNEPVPS